MSKDKVALAAFVRYMPQACLKYGWQMGRLGESNYKRQIGKVVLESFLSVFLLLGDFEVGVNTVGIREDEGGNSMRSGVHELYEVLFSINLFIFGPS
jgi:hypothetical protein